MGAVAIGGRNTLIILFAVALALCFGGCGAYRKADGIEDYGLFLQNYAKYSDVTKPPEIPVLPNAEYIEGFAAVTDLSILENVYVVCEENGLKGVRTLAGKVILPCNYGKIEIAGSTIVAVSENRVSVYSGENLVNFAEREQSVGLLSQNYLLLGDKVCDLNFNEQFAFGHKYLGAPHEGIVTVELAGGYVGYADTEKNVLIGGEFTEVSDFCEGVAAARKESGEYVVIDKSGNELYSSKEKKFGNRVNGYHVYVKQNVYGVISGNFAYDTGAIFPFLRYEYATGNYVIPRYNKGYAIYSLKENEFTGAEHEQIDYACGTFICRDGNKTVLRDKDLKIIAECEHATIIDNVLTVRKNGKCFYYVAQPSLRGCLHPWQSQS